MAPTDDASLVGAARGGDRAAFGRLYDRYARMVHGIVLGRIPHGEADDVVHDVFLQAMRRLNTLRDLGSFGPWLARIAHNQTVDHHRRAHPTQELPEEIPSDSGQPDGEAAFVLQVIRALPQAYRDTLIFRLVEGMTGPEIAERTGLTPASVRVNLHRGMKLLRERLREAGRAGTAGSGDGEAHT